MREIAPSILAADFLNLNKDLEKLEKTDAEWLHIDVMDGHFVKQITFGFNLIKKIKENSSKRLDIHLMVSNPEFLINELLKLKVDAITIHAEILDNFDYKKYFQKFKSKNIKFGLALNPATDPTNYKNIIKEFDLILIMSVNPGLGGQSFMEEVIPKILKVKKLIADNTFISIDGGINAKSIQKLQKEPLNLIVSGSYLFAGNIQNNINKLR